MLWGCTPAQRRCSVSAQTLVKLYTLKTVVLGPRLIWWFATRLAGCVAAMLCLRVPLVLGESVRKTLLEQNLLDKKHRIVANKDFLYIPVSGSKKAIKSLFPSFVLVDKDLPLLEAGKVETLGECLGKVLSEEELDLLGRSYDVIGSIVVVDIPPSLRHKEKEIGEAFLDCHKSVRTVVRKDSPVSEEYRTRGYRVVAGEKTFVTTHREYGCRYRVNIAEAYFNPRMAFERRRIASKVARDEVVADMFTGVGPFAIMVAKYAKPSKVFAIEKNPSAYKLLLENIELNKVQRIVKPVLGDIREVSSGFHGLADRVIMDHPSQSQNFLEVAYKLLKKGETHIHIYMFAEENQKTKLVENLSEKLVSLGAKPLSIAFRRVYSYSPRTNNYCFDITLAKS